MPAVTSFFNSVYKCFFSPKLYRFYNAQPKEVYEPNNLEKWGDTIIQTAIVLYHASLYASPAIAYTAYKRGYFTHDGTIFLLKLGTAGLLVLGLAYVLRAFGRATNSTYMEFNDRYRWILSNYNSKTKKQLQNYEFDFSYWPVDFSWNSNDKYRRKLASECNGCTFLKALRNPISLIGYLAVHSFAIKLIYPGSIAILNYAIKNSLETGRKKLIEEKGAERFKVSTADNNELDVIFLDHRGITSFGSTLVICTEGNAGFYEIGIVITPLDLGYSVLGWNHPGFGCSTGTPYINQEKCAIEAILQFASQKLNFSFDNIVLFGWSIGGFDSSYAATIYPDIKAVILDATFDEILPLAAKQMPKILEPFVNIAITDHANLDVASHLIQYNGSILLIRRSEDEIISISEGDITTNRGNFLLHKILKSRFPNLFTNESQEAFNSWLAVTIPKKDLIYEKYQVDMKQCKAMYEAYKLNHEREYPWTFGKDFDSSLKIQMLLYLASVYMIDFPSSHCTSLPSSIFRAFSDL